MPVYDYLCSDCHKEFETVLTLDEHDHQAIRRLAAELPGCREVERQDEPAGVVLNDAMPVMWQVCAANLKLSSVSPNAWALI